MIMVDLFSINYQEMEEGYAVEKILLKRFNHKGKPEYLVKWENYPTTQSTWEPLQNLENVLDLVEEYEKQDKDEVVTTQRSKTRHIKRPMRESRRQQPNQTKDQTIRRPKTRGRPRKQQEKIIELRESEEESKVEGSREELGSDVDIDPHVQGEVWEEKEDSRSVADAKVGQGTDDSVQVVSVRVFDEDLYFVVRYGRKLKLVTHKHMRKYYPLELIAFYEKNIVTS